MSYSERVPAAERTLQILELLSTTSEGLAAGEIEMALEIPRSALFALLNTLKNMGYIQQDAPRRPYRPGPRLQALRIPRPVGTTALTQAFREETATRTPEETLALVIMEGTDALVVAEAPCEAAVRVVLPPGKRRSAHEDAAGIVLLAGLPQTALDHRFPDQPADIPALLQETRHQTAAQLAEEGLVNLAVPVCPDGYQPEAALTMGIPTFRWSQARGERLLQSLRETAARLSHRLGALTYQPYRMASASRFGPSRAMGAGELKRFLNGPWAARLACVRPDGSPHVVPVWYEWRDDTFLVAAWPGSLWAGYVQQKPAVALTIDEPWPPMRRVLVRGQACPLPSGGAEGHAVKNVETLYRRLSARYLGLTVETMLPGEGWQAFEIVPETVVARKQVEEAEIS